MKRAVIPGEVVHRLRRVATGTRPSLERLECVLVRPSFACSNASGGPTSNGCATPHVTPEGKRSTSRRCGAVPATAADHARRSPSRRRSTRSVRPDRSAVNSVTMSGCRETIRPVQLWDPVVIKSVPPSATNQSGVMKGRAFGERVATSATIDCRRKARTSGSKGEGSRDFHHRRGDDEPLTVRLERDLQRQPPTTSSPFTFASSFARRSATKPRATFQSRMEHQGPDQKSGVDMSPHSTWGGGVSTPVIRLVWVLTRTTTIGSRP
jgi:hypothetical protein